MRKWQDVTPQYLLELLENGQSDSIQLIDVRESFEWDYYHIEPAELIPMNAIPNRMGELDESKTTFVICAHGVRSRAVCDYLEEQGYSDLRNVTGGMAAIASLKGFQYD